jgi:hypothetical protein
MFSCKSDSPGAITLHTPQQNDNSIVLNWDKTGIEDFEYYMVMRSHDKNKYNLINDISNKSSDAYNADITTFTDNTYPVGTDTLYYKIIAMGKTQTAQSSNICFSAKQPVIISGNNDIRDMYYIPEADRISIFCNTAAGNLKTLDLETGEVLFDTPLNTYASNRKYLWGTYNGQTEFYFYDYNNKIYVYNAATAQKVMEIECPSYPWNSKLAVNNKGQIYVFDGHRTLYTINRETGKYTEYKASTSLSGYGYLYYNHAASKLYAVNMDNYAIFSLDGQGNITGDTKYNYPVNINNIIDAGSQLPILSSSEGYKILNLHTNALHNLQLPAGYVLSVACLAGNSLYIACEYNNVICQLSAIDYKFIETYKTRSEPLRITASKDYLYYLEWHDYNKYILNKIKLK